MNSILSVSKVHFSYSTKKVLNDISFEVQPGSYLSIIGPNASGKTTLFNIISGYQKPQDGSILFNGKSIQKMRIQERAKKIAVIYQHTDSSFPFTCLETVLLGLHPHRSHFGMLSKEQLHKAREIMELTDTWILAEQQITNISGGELQRVLLAKALLQEPELLLLDEAMSDFDIAVKHKMTQLMKRLVHEKQITVIAINHDLSIAFQYSDKIIALKGGRLFADGTPEQLQNEEFFNTVFGVEARIFPSEGFFIHDISHKS